VLFVTEYLQCAHKVVHTDKKTYHYRMAPESATNRRYDLALMLSAEAANNKVAAIYEQVAPARLYGIFMHLTTIMIDIAIIYLRDGQKTEAKAYLRKARAMAGRICRDRHAPVSVKLKALLKVYCYRLFDAYAQVVKVRLPQAIKRMKGRKAAYMQGQR
jgi:hypothetical protein